MMSAFTLVCSGLGFYQEIIQTPPTLKHAWLPTFLLGGALLFGFAVSGAILVTRSAERTTSLCFWLFIVMHWLVMYTREWKRVSNKETTAYPIILSLAWNHLCSLINPFGKMGPFALWKVHGMSVATFTVATLVLLLWWAELAEDGTDNLDGRLPFRGSVLVFSVFVSPAVFTLLCGAITAAGYICKFRRSRWHSVAPFSEVTPAQLPPTIPGRVPGPRIADDTSLTSYHSYKDALERALLGAPGVSMHHHESAEWSEVLQRAADMVEAQISEQRRRSALQAWHLRIEALASSMTAARLNTVMRLPLETIRGSIAVHRWQMGWRAGLVDAWVSLRSLEEWLKMRTRTGLPDNVCLHVAEFLLVPPSFLRTLKYGAEQSSNLSLSSLPQKIGMPSAGPKASWADQLAGDIPKLVTSILEEFDADFIGLPEARS